MVLSDFRHNTTGNIKWSLTIGLALVFTLFLFIGLSWIHLIVPLSGRSSQSEAEPKYATSGSHRDEPDEQGSLTEPVPGTSSREKSDGGLGLVEAQQAKAAHAAIEAKPIDGHIFRRPEFVSEVEWDVLQDVALHNPEMEQPLTHLVNKLLFYKKREAWMSPTMDTDRRKALAGELLDMIPGLVDKKEVDPVFAEKLEQDLRNYLGNETDDGSDHPE